MAVLALVSSDCAAALDLVDVWLGSGQAVEVVLLDAAAATVRPGHIAAPRILRAIDAGAVVRAHDEAVVRRGIAVPLDGVKTVTLDELADLIGDTTAAVVWL